MHVRCCALQTLVKSRWRLTASTGHSLWAHEFRTHRNGFITFFWERKKENNRSNVSNRLNEEWWRGAQPWIVYHAQWRVLIQKLINWKILNILACVFKFLPVACAEHKQFNQLSAVYRWCGIYNCVPKYIIFFYVHFLWNRCLVLPPLTATSFFFCFVLVLIYFCSMSANIFQYKRNFNWTAFVWIARNIDTNLACISSDLVFPHNGANSFLLFRLNLNRLFFHFVYLFLCFMQSNCLNVRQFLMTK